MTLRVYLDVNHWITLSRIRRGLERDPALCAVYGQIVGLTRSGGIVVPFSLFTAIEASRYRKREGYSELVDVMVDLSRGHVIKPSSYFFGKEIENAMSRLVGEKPAHDIRSEIIGRGPADMINYTLDDIKKKTPPGLHRAFQYVLSRGGGISEQFEAMRGDADALKRCLMSDGFLSDVREAYGSADGAISDAEARRHKNSGMCREEHDRRLIVDDFYSNLIDEMSRWSVRHGIQAHEIKNLLTPDNVEAFRRSMPAHHTRFTLARARDRKADKSIMINDLLDIAHLAAAIPYTDMVVTDKMAAHLATSEKLDEMYGCVVLDDLKGLAGVPPFRRPP